MGWSIYSTNNGGKTVMNERFKKTPKSQKKMKANGSKYYVSYLNELIDQDNNNSINKKPIDADYSPLTEKI